MKSSEYINQERREYSLYVLHHRAIPYASDGLKAAARRVLWMARDGKHYKAATLAAATIPIHPHQAPESAVNTLAAPFINNIPLLQADGAFGTLLKPTAYGATRYTSVNITQFTKDVVFRDIEIIPMQENYDGTQMEPEHFLPLVPLALLNPQSGIAVGFASNILPRSLPDIIKSQLEVLERSPYFTDPAPALMPTGQISEGWVTTPQGDKAVFHGTFERTSATSVKITNLPYGITHEKYIAKLNKMIENDRLGIIDYTDRSRDKYNIDVKYKRGILNKSHDDEISFDLDLSTFVGENMTVISFDGETVWNTTYQEFITEFCEWRLGWYVHRYRRLADLLVLDIERYKDILLAIRKNVGGMARRIKTKADLKEFLTGIGVIHVDYIADLPVYRFTEEEKNKVQERLKEATKTLREYNSLLKSEKKRRIMYVSELNEILSNFKRGLYA